jgi:uncharacterized membrane protein (UPF0127 family)
MMWEQIEDGALLRVKANGVLLARHVRACVSSNARRIGLLGEHRVEPDGGALLFLPRSRRGKSGPATAIHTLGMRFAIAAAWLGAGGQVVHSQLAKPWLPYLASPRPAHFVLEVHPEHLSRLDRGVEIKWDLSRPEVDR